MASYAELLGQRLQQGIRVKLAQRRLAPPAPPVVCRQAGPDGREHLSVRSSLPGHDGADDYGLYWPISQLAHLPVREPGKPETAWVAFGLDYGPSGLGRLYSIAPAEGRPQARTVLEFEANAHGLLQAPAALLAGNDQDIYVLMAYPQAGRQADAASGQPTGALWRIVLKQGSEPECLHEFTAAQGWIHSYAPDVPVSRQRAVESAWLQNDPAGMLIGRLSGADGQGECFFRIARDGSGLQLLRPEPVVFGGMRQAARDVNGLHDAGAAASAPDAGLLMPLAAGGRA